MSKHVVFSIWVPRSGEASRLPLPAGAQEIYLWGFLWATSALGSSQALPDPPNPLGRHLHSSINNTWQRAFLYLIYIPISSSAFRKRDEGATGRGINALLSRKLHCSSKCWEMFDHNSLHNSKPSWCVRNYEVMPYWHTKCKTYLHFYHYILEFSHRINME